MFFDSLLPAAWGVRLDAWDLDSDRRILTFSVTATQTQALCPLCTRPSSSVHSRYVRTVADLPCADLTVRLRLSVRKFFCRNDTCARTVFTERLPGLVAPWGRRSLRLQEVQRQIGLQLGGEAGTRLSLCLQMAASPDTLLRTIRHGTLPEVGLIRALGVDDWARHKGQTYGTILVDLEAHRIVDLLPDRSAETLAQWLYDHPGIEVIARDRANAYADGATRGAPDAAQAPHTGRRWSTAFTSW